MHGIVLIVLMAFNPVFIIHSTSFTLPLLEKVNSTTERKNQGATKPDNLSRLCYLLCSYTESSERKKYARGDTNGFFLMNHNTHLQLLRLKYDSLFHTHVFGQIGKLYHVLKQIPFRDSQKCSSRRKMLFIAPAPKSKN